MKNSDTMMIGIVACSVATCNKGIEVWLDNTLCVAGERERQLASFYGLREMFLEELRTYRR